MTGSLNAAAAQWLVGSGRAATPYVAAQGTAMGRLGRVHVGGDDEGSGSADVPTSSFRGAQLCRRAVPRRPDLLPRGFLRSSPIRAAASGSLAAHHACRSSLPTARACCLASCAVAAFPGRLETILPAIESRAIAASTAARMPYTTVWSGVGCIFLIGAPRRMRRVASAVQNARSDARALSQEKWIAL